MAEGATGKYPQGKYPIHVEPCPTTCRETPMRAQLTLAAGTDLSTYRHYPGRKDVTVTDSNPLEVT